MAVQILKQNYAEEVKTIKNAISVSRYRAAKQANTAQLGLYYSVGGYISQHTRNAKWGTGIVEQLSKDLQNEFPSTDGFTARNLWMMKQWYLFYSNPEHEQKLKQAASVFEQYAQNHTFALSQITNCNYRTELHLSNF